MPFHDLEYGYDAVGNMLWKRDGIETDRSERYEYDERHRLVQFERGTLAAGSDPSMTTPSNDADMPNLKEWLDLDRRGNWLELDSTVQNTTTEQDRTLHAVGGPMNEYDRIDMSVGGLQTIQQLDYDDAGNLIATNLLGDMDCDGDVDFDDIDAFYLALSNPSSYATTYPDCMIELGDINGDGDLDFDDIDLFTDLIGGTMMDARRFVYDEENRLTAVTDIDDDPLLEIDYDALGRRIESRDYTGVCDPCGDSSSPVETRHIKAGVETIEEYVFCDDPVSGEDWYLAREFIWGERFPEPLVLTDWTSSGDVAAATAEVLHYVHDAMGSVVGLTDAGDPDATPTPIAAKLVERYDYDPYGHTYVETWDASAGGGSGAFVRQSEPVSAYGNPFMWTAQRYDAGVGLYSFPARAYSPRLGRWLQRDPLGFVDGVNMYEYCRSMPTPTS